MLSPDFTIDRPTQRTLLPESPNKIVQIKLYRIPLCIESLFIRIENFTVGAYRFNNLAFLSVVRIYVKNSQIDTNVHIDYSQGANDIGLNLGRQPIESSSQLV